MIAKDLRSRLSWRPFLKRRFGRGRRSACPRRRHERSARFLPEPARSDGGRADQSWRTRLRHLFAAFEGAHHLHYRPDQQRLSYTGCRAATGRRTMSMSLEAAAQAMRDAMRETVKRHSLWYLMQGILMVLGGILAVIYPIVSSVAVVL